MKHILLTALLLCAFALRAEDRLTLKDGQMALGSMKGYDAFFLDFQAGNGTQFHVPWGEIFDLRLAEESGDKAIIQQYLNPQIAYDVKSHIQAKDPMRAELKAWWPGVLIHGRGFKEAGNPDMFLSLAGAELFSILVGGFGAARAGDVSLSQGERDTAQALALGGAGVFALTWVIDLIGAPLSATALNRENGLALGVGVKF